MKTYRKITLLLLLIFPWYLTAQNIVKVRSCEDAVKYSLENNKKILISRQSASAEVCSARKDIGAFIPKVNISFNDSSIVNPSSNDYKNKNLSIGFSWLLYDAGQQKNEYKLKKIEALFEQLMNEENINDHCLQIMKIYFECQKELKNKEVFLQTIENSKKWKAAIEKEFSLGLIVETDYLDYEIKCLELEKELVEIEDRIFQLNSSLKNLLGMMFEDELIVIPSENLENEIISTDDDLNSIFHQSLSNSLEYKKLKVEFEYSEKLKELEKAFYLPIISIQPGISFQGEDYPLHGPKCQLMISFSFDRNPFLSFQGSQNLSSEKNVLLESTSYGQSSSKNQFAIQSQKKLEKLNFCNQLLSFLEFEDKLKMSICNLLVQKKQLIISMEIQKKEITVNEKLNLIIEKEVEQGQKRTLDLLEHQIEFMKKKLCLHEVFMQIFLINKMIEKLTSNISGGNF